MKVQVLKVDYSDKQQAADIAYLLNCDAEDPMGGGEPLPDFAKKNLAKELLKIPHAFSVICYVDGKPAARITEHTWSIGHIHVSSGNSHHAEPMVGVAWSKVPPIYDRTADTERASRFFAELEAMWGDELWQ